MLVCGCGGEPSSTQSGAAVDKPLADAFREQRLAMVDEQIAARGVRDPRVLEAMRHVPRHRFVPESLTRKAYADSPLPIGHRQTISQPYIVALMTELVRPGQNDRVLDIGTGSGYQAAVLARLVSHVYSIEIVPELAESARSRLESLGIENVTVRAGDGYRGWPEHAPFDIIILAAAPATIPQPLVDQLAPGGRMVLPVGSRFSQRLILVEKDEQNEVTESSVVPVAFVPMTGEAQGE